MAVTFTFEIVAAPSTTDAQRAAGAAALRDMKFPLELDSNGNIAYLRDTEAIASDLKSRWLTFRGENFLDVEMGVDYFGVVFGRPQNLPAIEQEFRREALACPGISGIALQLVPDGLRELSVIAECTTDTGLVFTAALAVAKDV